MAHPGTPPRKTLIIHIGDHKTGSTSIQLAFAKQLVELPGKTVMYPAKLAMNAWGPRCVDYAQTADPDAQAAARRRLQQLAARIAKKDTDFVLISAEAFERVPAHSLRQVVDEIFAPVVDEIRIIAYVRPHAARLTSSYAERIKVGTRDAVTSGLEAFVAQRQRAEEFQYLPRFTAWAEQFGDAFTLRPMIKRALHNGSVVEDFLHHAFGGLPYQLTPDSQANESLCLEDLMRLKVVQGHMLDRLDRPLRLKLGWEMARIISHQPRPQKRSKLQLHRALAKTIRTSYLADARALDQRFFAGQPMMEQELSEAVTRAPRRAQSTTPADHLSGDEIRALTIQADLCATLLQQPDINWSAVLHQKRIDDVERSVAGRRADAPT